MLYCNGGLWWSELPTDPNEQNRLWYSIYKSIEYDTRILSAHKDWLFSRDLAAYAILFQVVFGIALFFFSGELETKIYYGIFLAVQYFVAVIVARTYGERFVTNVLANGV